MIRHDYRKRLTYIPGGALSVAAGPWPSASGSPGTSPGTTNLISWWALDETSGQRNDSHGTNHLGDVNTVLYGTGKQGNAADFEYNNAEFLQITDNASLSTGDIDFTFAAWVWFESIPGSGGRTIAGKFNVGGNQREWALLFEYSSGNSLKFVVSNDGAAITTLTSITPSASTWYFLVAWHDATANTINLQINNGTPYSTGHTTGVYDSTAAFALGIIFNTAYISTYAMDGLMDEACFYKRVLTADERTWLYNSGNGRAYSEL